MFETLSSHGITPSVLQILIIVAITVVILGMFWQYILAGAAILFCVYVFIIPDASTKEVKKPETVKSVVVEEKDDTPIEYIQDCMRYTSKNETACIKLWHERENDE